ncbi:MAG TPA: choice-of-anchor D domain-containing protein [Polyangiaceae bacterium]|nr:choice-of-anchor D domain-containing protein [Polyangiaceae bacterium]
MNFALRFRTLKVVVLLTVSPLIAAQCDSASLSISGARVVDGTSWHAYGLVAVGSVKTQTFTITNSGSASARLGVISLASYGSGRTFTLSGGSCKSAETLAPNGGSCTLAVTYAPTEPGHAQSILSVPYNWPDNGPVERVLSLSSIGTGAHAGARVAFSSAPEYDFGTKAIGTSLTKTLSLANTGMEAARLDAGSGLVLGLSPPFSLTGGSCSARATLAPVRALTIEEAAASTFPPLPAADSSCTLTFTFTPARVGASSAAIGVSYSAWSSGFPEPQANTLLRGTGETFWPVQQLSLGGRHTCAVLASGNVRCWGDGSYGKLGYEIPSAPCGPTCLIRDDTIGNNELPLTAGFVDIGGRVVSLDAGTEHTCAVLDSGGVRCWGMGYSGRLGYGNEQNVGESLYPSGMGDVNLGSGKASQVSAGAAHNCALLNDGKVRCWGYNSAGQLGYGNTATLGDDELPAGAGDVQVGGEVRQLTAGDSHTCALLVNGKVRCWGFGGVLGYGEGTPTIGDDELPESAGDVNVGGDVIEVTAGSSHTCALLGSGKVRCWGLGSYGALGYGNTRNLAAPGADVDIGGDVVQISAGANHTCALLSTRRVRCWGHNGFGQLGYGHQQGIGDNESPASAGDVNVGGNVRHVAAGHSHTCAVLTNGHVRCWGNAKYWGQLGYGNENSVGDDETPATAGDVVLQ